MRVAAKRQRELMCIIKYMNSEDYEWHDEDDVDLAGDPPQDCEMSVELGTIIS